MLKNYIMKEMITNNLTKINKIEELSIKVFSIQAERSK